MSAHNFWDNFRFGFRHGMFNSNPFFGCFGGWGMPFGGFGGFWGAPFSCFNSCFAPPIMPLVPNIMSGNFAPLMQDIAPPFCNLPATDFNSVFTNTTWTMPTSPFYTIGDTFKSTIAPKEKNTTKIKTEKGNNIETGIEDKAKLKDTSHTNLLSNTVVNDKYFDKMYQHIREREGGYSNNKNDRGGETNFGVTHTTYDEYRKKKNLPKRSVKLITQEEVKEIYFNIYKKSGADKIKDPQIAFVIFDYAINSGPGGAKKLLKKCGGDLNKLEQLRREHYANIVKRDEKQRVNLKGWNNRLDAVIAFAKKELPSNVA